MQSSGLDGIIETPRLRLRPAGTSDAARVADYASDYDVARMITSMPHPFAVEDAVSFLEDATGPNGDQAVFAIDDPETGLIGLVSFGSGPDAEFGYWLGKPWWGKGLATEAAVAALDWARGTGRKFSVAGHFADNAASGAVLCKAGFLYTGEVQTKHCRARNEQVPTRMMVWLA